MDGLLDNVRTRGCGEELDTHETLSGMRKNGFRPTSHRQSRTASAPVSLHCVVSILCWLLTKHYLPTAHIMGTGYLTKPGP